MALPLAEALVETAGANVTHTMHDPLGILTQQRPDASWRH
jgi:hypothetical protein